MAPKSNSRRASAGKKGQRKTKKKSVTPRSWKRRIWGVVWRLGVLSVLVLAGYLVYLDTQVRKNFEQRQWALPAHVFARPLEFYVGKSLKQDDLLTELKLLGYRKVSKFASKATRKPGSYISGKNRVELISRQFDFWDGVEASRQVRIRFKAGKVSALQSLDGGGSITLLRLDPVRIGGIYPSRIEDRSLVRLEEVPKTLTEALITVEDHNFRHHIGVDPKAVLRAAWVNLQAGSVVQGGSTLTQQLIKNLFLTRERSFKRKISEALMAPLLELHYGKDEILETYLNEVYLGQDGVRAIHGFGLASYFYFGRPLNELPTEQSALLVSLVKGPSYYNPRRHAKRAKKRRNVVISVLEREKVITVAEADRARAAGLGLVPRARNNGVRFPAFLELVRRQLRRDYREEDLTTEGLKVFSTLDPIVQQRAQDSLRKRIKYLEKRHKPKGVLQGAVVVTENNTGEVQAVVGGREIKYGGFNRALDAVRPIGSLIKPAVYLSALEEPSKYTLASMLDDSELNLKVGKQVWSPKNAHGGFNGDVLLIDALAQSYNPASARLGMELGLGRVHASLKRLGVLREAPEVPAMLLGAFNLAPIDVAQMYQTMASEGFRVPLRSIREVMNTDGRPLSRYALQVDQVFDQRAVHLINRAMQEVTKTGTARYLSHLLPTDTRIAGKTGTTDGLRDSWFAGFDKDRLTVVWLGLDNNKSARVTGTTGAMLVWADVMRGLGVRSLDKQPLSGMTLVEVDRKTGLWADKGCEKRLNLPFVTGSAPVDVSPCANKQPVVQSVFSTLLPTLQKKDVPELQAEPAAKVDIEEDETGWVNPFWWTE